MPSASDVKAGNETDFLLQRQQQQEEKPQDRHETYAAESDEEGKEESSLCEDACEDDNDDASSVDGEDEEEETTVPFATDEEANEARAVGIAHYNNQRYEDALDIQYRVVRHFEKKYGATAPICGVYFLDYGLSQLRVLQSKAPWRRRCSHLIKMLLKPVLLTLMLPVYAFRNKNRKKGRRILKYSFTLQRCITALRSFRWNVRTLTVH
ncbi:hypothetical protein MOQ_007138 [Trypanosoma cruzi marinkellei]|uniref:Uncharacterized protein n=1 Tax=Trypanosoma cruzi marinkellei TaxID=85056 RepID=K2NJP0_TRYCR|nr:hypothetical protein MOQ_007138 [Trypanosoma cruzi marinkellei]